MKYLFFLPFVVLLLCAAGECVMAENTKPNAIFRPVYMSPDKLGYYSFDGKLAKYEYIHAHRSLQNEKYSDENNSDLGGNAPSHDCSSAEFLCVTMNENVMAIPRHILSPDAIYEVENNTLKVVDCYRGTSQVCQVALIEAVCLYTGGAGADQCVLARNKGKEKVYRRARLYFFYNKDYGVTGFGFPLVLGDVPEIPVNQMATLAGEFQLVGEQGLLKKDKP